MKRKTIFSQVMDKGGWFSFVFFLFFMTVSIPLIVLFVASIVKFNLPGLALSLVLAGVLAKDFRAHNLFIFSRDMAILNMTLWFLLGFLSILKNFVGTSTGSFIYIMLVPYALISGYLVFYLLSKADKQKKKVLQGGVAVSTMIAVISAINGAISGLLDGLATKITDVVSNAGTLGGWASWFIEAFRPSNLDPHTAFLLVFVFFNIPFITYYLKKNKEWKDLLWYLIPLGTYMVLYTIWQLVQEAAITAIVVVA